MTENCGDDGHSHSEGERIELSFSAFWTLDDAQGALRNEKEAHLSTPHLRPPEDAELLGISAFDIDHGNPLHERPILRMTPAPAKRACAPACKEGRMPVESKLCRIDSTQRMNHVPTALQMNGKVLSPSASYRGLRMDTSHHPSKVSCMAIPVPITIL